MSTQSAVNPKANYDTEVGDFGLPCLRENAEVRIETAISHLQGLRAQIEQVWPIIDHISHHQSVYDATVLLEAVTPAINAVIDALGHMDIDEMFDEGDE